LAVGDNWRGTAGTMRGSEEKYWANANQHPVDHPNAGV